jgi:DNA-binding transcriptional LysR family regulator
MRSLNLDQLRTLSEVVAHGSFSAAARRLNLTQPAVSLQIRELERRFGVRLIERQGKLTYPTAPGRDLVDMAQRIFRECDRANAAMHRFRDGSVGRVHIATTLTALTYRLPPILRRLRTEHPGIDLHVTQMPTRDSVESIIQNKFDFALVTLPVDDSRLTVTPLHTERLVAIFPASARDLPDEITPEYCAQQPLLMEHAVGAIRKLVLGWLGGQASLLRTTMHLGTIEALKSAVAAELGMSIVPAITVAAHNAGIVVRPLRPPLLFTLGLIERHDMPAEPALEIVRNALLALQAPGESESEECDSVNADAQV